MRNVVPTRPAAVLALLLGVMSLLLPVTTSAQSQDERDLQTALHLSLLLQSSRSVIATNQKLINSDQAGDKGLTGERVLADAIAAFLASNSKPPIYAGQDAREARLVRAQMTAIVDVMDANQSAINQEGVGFKGFVPAVFGRLVNERFAELVGDEATIKVTAPPELVRNRKARPDAWETGAILDKLQAPDWPVGQVFAGVASINERNAFRVLVPEYYSEGCLSCHGSPAGEIDVTGYPKEGGRLGDLGGVISVSLFR